MKLTFPKGFLWGVATSSYQIEGAWNDDGKGESIWDHFVHKPYTILNADTGDKACEHYYRMPEDVELMKSLGLQAYRFSISWPRVLPEGRGKPNSPGLDFYDRLVDNLLSAGIQPVANLDHWDFPQALQAVGGWANRDCTDWFADYAQLMFDRLGDRVSMWSTHNEPWVLAFLGHGTGEHAPGICNYAMAYQVAHHLLLGHGKAVQVFRQSARQGQIGIILNLNYFLPASDREADIAACRRVYMENVSLFLEPLFFGRYPQELFDWIGFHQPKIHDGDLDIIRQPIDFLGVNHYFSESVSHAVNGPVLKARNEPYSAPGWGRTTMNWGINPQGFEAVLLDIKDNYGNPTVFITENGCSFPDVADEHGVVADWDRVNYLRAHMHAAYRALQAGLDLRGYFVWSLMDNFEWAWGYSRRFGLVRVDYPTQKRIPKQSATWYSQVIAANGIDI